MATATHCPSASWGLSAFVLILAPVLFGGCASLPDDFERPVSEAFMDTADSRLGETVQRVHLENAAHSGESGFRLLGNGIDAFAARAALAQTADRSIDAQYYLLHNDHLGRLFSHQLLKAADRGVRVRLLVDDMDLSGRTFGAAVLDSHPNIQVRLFNPFHRGSNRTLQLVTRFGSVTRRMHNKSFTVDNQVAIVGGRNIGDAYFSADEDVNFTDIDVLLIGPVVQQVSESFDRYWNSELAYPATALLGRETSAEELREQRAHLDRRIAEANESAYMAALQGSDLAKLRAMSDLAWEWGPAQVVYDSPEKITASRTERQLHLGPKLKPYFEGVDEELVIVSPYFVPGEEGADFLIALVERGVRVIVLTNALSSTDVPVVHAGYAKYRKRLLRGGVELFEYKPSRNDAGSGGGSGFPGSSDASLHSKVFIFDRKHFFIGSVNFDPRSVFENTEIGVVLESPELGEEVGRRLDEHLPYVAYRLAMDLNADGYDRLIWHEIDTGGTMRTFSFDPETGFWQRFSVGLLGLLPLESQL